MLVVSYTAEAGGAGRSLLDFLASIEPRPVLAVPEGPVAAWARAAGTTVVELPPRPLELRGGRRAAARALGGHARDVRRLVRELEPATVVAWGMRSAIAAAPAVARSGARLVVRHGDLAPSPAIARALRMACRRAELTICASRAIATDLGPVGRVEVVHPGVDLERLRPPEAAPPDGAVLLLGAIVGWKRPDLALEAVAALPEARLRVVGEPFLDAGRRLLDDLRRRAEQPDLAGRVEFAGAVADPDAELAAASCLLHCADAEPFGRVVAEALACGLPVVAPAAGGPAELVDDSCGRLYRPGDAGGATRALSEVREDRDRLSAGARARAEATVDIRDTRRRYRELVPADAPAPSAPATSLVTVIHDSEPELRALLGSLERHLPGMEVIVVDSGSADAGADVARAAGAKVVELGENVGYGRAVNAGLAQATTAVTIVANPDLELVDGSLAGLATAAERSDRLLAPVLLRPDGARQDSVHPLPSSAPELSASLIPPAALPGPARLPADPWLANQQRRVGWAAGACLAARTELLERLGPFSEEIFLYGEDLDLGLRAAEQGIETWFWPHARVLHHHGHATRREGERFELLARQRREVVERRLGPARRRRDDLAQALTFANRIALKTVLRRPTERERRQLAALRRAARRG